MPSADQKDSSRSSSDLQWNLHKTDTIGDSLLAVIERWSSLRGFESQPQYTSLFILQMNLGEHSEQKEQTYKITSVGRLRFGTTKCMESHPQDDPFLIEFARYACMTFGLVFFALLSCLFFCLSLHHVSMQLSRECIWGIKEREGAKGGWD